MSTRDREREFLDRCVPAPNVTASLTCTLIFLMGVSTPLYAADASTLASKTVQHTVQCPLPKDVPCSIKKPVLSGYHVLSEGVVLDDRGEFWIADLSKQRKQGGQTEPIRVLSDMNVLHLIGVTYPVAPKARATTAKSTQPPKIDKDKPETPAVEKTPNKPRAVATKPTAPGAEKKTSSKIEACVSKCREAG